MDEPIKRIPQKGIDRGTVLKMMSENGGKDADWREAQMSLPKCPKCGSRENIPIAYSLAGTEMAEDEIAGKIKLGGCVITESSPTRYCNNCGNRWRHIKPKSTKE